MTGIRTGLVANRYASALIGAAEEKKSLDRVEADLAQLAKMITQSTDLSDFIGNPMIGRTAQAQAMTALAKKAGFSDITRNFLNVLAANRRLASLPNAIRAFERALAARRGEVNVRVESVSALTPAQTETLRQELGKALGSRVTLDVAVNKDLLGGMVVTVGSVMVDDSVRRKLERLKRALSGAQAA